MARGLRQSLATNIRTLRFRFGQFTHEFSGAISAGSAVLNVAATVASVVCLIAMIVLGGYDHTPGEISLITGVLRTVQGIFLANVLFNLILRLRATVRDSRIVKWIVEAGLLLTLLPLLYPHPEHPWIPWLERLLYSRYFLNAVLTAYSVVELSFAVMSLAGRRTNPSLLLSGSFLFFILSGSFILMLPRFTAVPIDYIDSLFVATSAVCITGLTPVDIASTFTPEGYIVLCVLFQVGALGVLTFTCFFALFFSGTASVYNQLLIRDMIYSKTMNALVPTLLYILFFTLAVEAAGAVAVYFTIPETLGLAEDEKVMFAVFHSMSSFCNVGFSCLPQGMSNPALMTAGQSVYTVTSVLVIAGGIGFPILANFKDIIVARIKYGWRRLRRHVAERPAVHYFDLNTKLVLRTYFIILVAASVAFFILEYNNTLAGMSVWQKAVQSVFNSLVPRSAGFSSVSPSDFLPLTMLLIVVQMWIGGGSQSLAGGIKVNTVAAIFLNIRAIVKGASRPWAFDRAISVGTIRRANAVVSLAIVSWCVTSALLLFFEPGLSTKALLFEATSALFTVGSSLGVTPELGTGAKMTVCVAMFIGRVGLVSLLTGLVRQGCDVSQHLPEEHLIIN